MLATRPTAVLIISPEKWSAHPVSKHHYARVLARQSRPVLFAEPPDPRLSEVRLVAVEDEPCIQLVQGPRVAPALRFMPSRLRRYLEHRWLEQLECIADMPITAVWLFENSRFYDLRFAGERLKIYHQVDLNQNFHPCEAARTADICFCTTELIRQELATHNSRVFRLHHGLAPAYLKLELDLSQRAFFDPDGVHVAYVGNLDMAYLDRELLIRLIKSHPNVHFHLVGSFQSSNSMRDGLKDCSHVKWWGRVPSSLIPRILEKVDLQLVCYQAKHHSDQASPHKFMEYLAGGRAIVATYTEEYVQYSDLIPMSSPNSNTGYMDLFDSVLVNLEYWNSPKRVEARQAFAADFTYERQLQRIEARLREFKLPSLSGHLYLKQ